jgi:hypothetical protein
MRRIPSDASNAEARNYVYANSEATGSDLLVLMSLADYANSERQCWPSVETLAAHAGLGRSTVKRSISALENVGEISVQRRFDAHGDPTSNLYTLLILREGYKTEDRRKKAPAAASAPKLQNIDWWDLDFAKRLAADDPELAKMLTVYASFNDETAYLHAFRFISQRIAEEKETSARFYEELHAHARASGAVSGVEG